MVNKPLTINQKIMLLLIENKEREFSIGEISKLILKDYKNTYEAIKTLDSISVVKKGGANMISFKPEFSEIVFQTENHRKEELLKKKQVRAIYKDLGKVNSQFILLVFGSVAKRKATAQSDIDLLLITDNPKEIQLMIQLYPTKIDLTAISYDEFKKMLLSKEFTVVSEAIKNNIVLFGLEDYYRLLENAR